MTVPDIANVSLTAISGVLTYGTTADWWENCLNPYSIDLFCAEQVWEIDNKPDGVVLFVKTDCVTLAPLPMDQQDPVYGLPGVALDRGVLSTMMSDWANDTCKTWLKTTPRGYQKAYEIHGKDFAEGPLGVNGANLKEKLDACGVSADPSCQWAFCYTPDDPYFDWMVTGCIAMPTESKPTCIGDALMAVGGKYRDQCL